MNELTEQARDGVSTGRFDDSLTNLLGGIPKTSPTMSEEEEHEEEEHEEPTEQDKKPVGKTPSKDPLEEEHEEEEHEEEEGSSDEQDEDEEPNIIDELAAEFGEVDFGEETEFETEGQAAKTYVKKLLETKSKDIGKAAVQGLFKQMPAVAALVEHLSQGYGLDSFLKENQPEEYTPINLEEADEDQKISVIKRAWKLKGLDDEEINDGIEAAKDANKIAARAESAQKFLKERHEEELEKIKTREKQQKEEQEEKAAKATKELNTILDSGKLAGGTVTLDKEKTKVLKEFIFNQDEQGNSVRLEAYKNLPMDKKLLLDYLVATDFKDLKFTNDSVKGKIARNIKIKNAGTSRVKIDNSSSSGSKKSGKEDSPFDIKGFFNSVNQ